MLKEIVHYYADTEPNIYELDDLKTRSVWEDKVFFVDYYCEAKEAIITLEINNEEVSIRQTIPVTHKKSNPQNISIDLIKQLRDRTGAGLLDCKAALLYNDEDLDKAQEWLRDKMFR